MEQIYNKKTDLHVLIDIFNVNSAILSDNLINNIFINRIINNLNLTVVQDIYHPYRNNCFLRVLLLEQGYININTKPNDRSIYVDISLGDIYFNVEQIINIIKVIYMTNIVEYHIISR